MEPEQLRVRHRGVCVGGLWRLLRPGCALCAVLETQQPVGRVGNPMDVANAVLFLASDKAGFITGENLCMDGGMTRQMIYHGEHGWQYGPETGQDGKS